MHVLSILFASLAYHLEILLRAKVLLLKCVTSAMKHLLNLCLNEQGMDDKVRLLDYYIENFITQISVNATLFALKNIITEYFAQIFDGFTLSITDFCRESIIQFWYQLLLHTMDGNHVVSLLTSELVINIISGDSRREFFGLTCLHTKQVLVHA